MKRFSLFAGNWIYFLAFFSLLYFVFAYINNNYILDREFYFSAFNSTMDADRILNLFNIQQKLQWVAYIFIPLILLIKWVVVAVTIFLGAYLFNYVLAFKEAFKIAAVAEFAPCTGILVKSCYFLFQKPRSVSEIQNFDPLSLMQLVNSKHQLPSYLIFFIQQFNVFEGVYWCLISMGLCYYLQISFLKALKVTASSYGVALFILILCIMFIMVQFS